MSRLTRSEEATALVEYGLMIGLIALVGVVSLAMFGDALIVLFSEIGVGNGSVWRGSIH
ncbi:MAG: Flp family type IVb pilin [Acidimicrobiia bacterium]|nr:Flp family type IVb pilin [Acidimicrobiia bacterium]